jgi:hypothetical protein
MRILFTGANHDLENWARQSYSLAHAAHRMGHFICSSFLDAPDVLICVDYHKRSEPLLSEAKIRGTPRVLIRQEPIVVQPLHGKKKLLERFELVITRGHPLERPQFNTFQEWDISEIDNATRFKRSVAISANKWSMIPGEYYSLRRKAYSQIGGIDVFGPGWNSSTIGELTLVAKEFVISLASGVFPDVSNLKWSLIRPQSYLGVAASKMQTLSRYEVSLVIENSEGYMSEKLVDCILAGTIPVYVGERVEDYGIPAGLVIQAEPTVEAIRSAISQALNWDGHRYRMEAKAWAQSPGVKENWENSCVSRKLLDHIEARFTVQESN